MSSAASFGDGQGQAPSSSVIPRVQSSESLPDLESVSSSTSSSLSSPGTAFLDFRSRTWERLEEGARQLSEEEFQALFAGAEGDASGSDTGATDGSGAILFAIAERVRSRPSSGGDGEVDSSALGGDGA